MLAKTITAHGNACQCLTFLTFFSINLFLLQRLAMKRAHLATLANNFIEIVNACQDSVK